MPAGHDISSDATYAQWGSYSGNVVSIANGAQGTLTWDTLGSGQALLNLTAPASPTVVGGGIYAINASVQGSGMTVDGYFDLVLRITPIPPIGADTIAIGHTQSRPAVAGAGHTTPIAGTACVHYMPAGGQLNVEVTSEDGVAARDFFLLEAVIQRLS